MTANIARSRFGRALVAIRDAEGGRRSLGASPSPHSWMAVFVFSGALAGVAGGLFSSLQSYITPDAFTFDLSVLFFIAILIGGRGSIMGPLPDTIILTVLPEFARSVAWSTFLYAALLLLIVLIIPGGIADLLDYKNRRPLERHREIVPRPAFGARTRPAHRRRPAAPQPYRTELRRRARHRRSGSGNPARRGARADRPQRQRQATTPP